MRDTRKRSTNGEEAGRDTEEGRERPQCFCGGVFPRSFCDKKAVRGLFPKHRWPKRPRHPEMSLFVCFECDPLSEEL
jgi:hypothetical protein